VCLSQIRVSPRVESYISTEKIPPQLKLHLEVIDIVVIICSFDHS